MSQIFKGAVVLFCLTLGSTVAFTPTRRPNYSSIKNRRNKLHSNIFLARRPFAALPQLSAAPIEVIPPSYDLAIGSLALGAAFGLPGSPLKSKLSSYLGGIPLLLFGLFLAFQTTTLRFTFDDENFALVKSDLSSTGENVVVGGENKWAYDKFVNYDFFPSRSFPILVYFKETQTPEENWNIGPGEQANSPEAIAKGAKPGQVHFFPAIGNVDKTAKGFETHGCAKIE